MRPPENAMKQRILVCLMILILAAVGLCGSAAAEEDPINIIMDLSANRFSGPAEVTVTIRVTNTSDKDMPKEMALYNPEGTMIQEFGTPILAAGATKTWTGTWMVTEEYLKDGRLTFGARYPVTDGSGNVVYKERKFSQSIVDAGSVAQVEINRYITPTMARKGQTVSVIYEVLNTGSIDVTDVVIKESSTVSKTSGKIALVKAGEKETYTFTFTMGTKNRTSNAAITYTANGKSYTDSKPDALIKYGDVKLEASVAADKKGGNPGDTVKLTLTLKNTGKSDYENVTVSDAALGTVFTGLTVPAGKTVTQEKEITIAETMDYMFVVSGTAASGQTVETTTERITVTAVDPAKEAALLVEAEVDKSTVYVLPGVVKFTVRVTNTSSVEAKDVTVSASGRTLKTFESIPAGATKTLTLDAKVEYTGNFRFDAKVKDQLGQTKEYQSNLVPIALAQPTATPTQAPLNTPLRPELEDMPTSDGLPSYVDLVQQVLGVGQWVLVGLAGVCAALVIAGIVGRRIQAGKSNKAPDHLNRVGYRDYMEAVPAKERHVMPDNEEETRASVPARPAAVAEKPAEDAKAEEKSAAQPDATVTDAVSGIYAGVADATDDQPADDAQEENTYRRRRRSDDEA